MAGPSAVVNNSAHGRLKKMKMVVIVMTVAVGAILLFLLRSNVLLGHNKMYHSLTQEPLQGSLSKPSLGPTIIHDDAYEDRVSNHHQVWRDEDRVVRRMEVCLEATNMTSYFEEMGYMNDARDNVKRYFRAMRTFVPRNFSSEFYSPCWRTDIQVTRGDMSNKHFRRAFDNLHRHFKTTIACLPKVFLLGVAKCGTTFAYCMMTKALGIKDVSSKKEPSWWIPKHSWIKSRSRDTKPKHVPPYFHYFSKAYSIMEKHDRQPHSVYYPPVTIDGTPNMLHEWIRSYYKEPPLNYCLMPSLIPVLVPSAKYVVILRNPVTFLYAKFWATCDLCVDKDFQVPNVFHEQVVEEIAIFKNCTRMYSIEKCASVDISESLIPTSKWKDGRTEIEYAMFYLHVYKWLSVISRENFFFMTLEELHGKASLKNAAQNLWNFLELPKPYTFPSVFDISQCSRKTNTKSYHGNPKLEMRADTRLLLKEFYQPFNEKLAALLGDRKFLWEDS